MPAGTAWGLTAAVAVLSLCPYGVSASTGQALVVSALVYDRLILRHRLGKSRSPLRWTAKVLGSILAYLCLPVTFALLGDGEALVGLLHPGSCWPHGVAALLGGAALGFGVASRVAALPRSRAS